MEDREIIKLFWERSEKAIANINLKYGPYCFKIAWNILFNREDSDECVSDTCLHAWNAIPPAKPDLLRAFLGRITRNLAINRYEEQHAKKRGGGQMPLCLDELSECVSGGDSPESVVDSISLRECIDNFLAGLGSEERLVFVSRYWYMMPVRDISREFSYGESKVKMMLLRMREKLRSRLVAEGFVV